MSNLIGVRMGGSYILSYPEQVASHNLPLNNEALPIRCNYFLSL